MSGVPGRINPHLTQMATGFCPPLRCSTRRPHSIYALCNALHVYGPKGIPPTRLVCRPLISVWP